MEHIEPIKPTESATDSTIAAQPAKRPWQTPTCTKFTADELTKFLGVARILDGPSSSLGS